MREFWDRNARATGVPWGKFEPGGWAKPFGWTPVLFAPAERAAKACVDQPGERGRERAEEGPEHRSPADWTASLA